MITKILKSVCAICTAACVITALSSCGSSNSSSSGGGESSVSNASQSFDLSAEEYMKKALEIKPNSLLDTTTAKGDTSDYGFDNFCAKLYGGLSLDELEDGAISYASTGGNADEVSVLKAAEGTDQSKLTKILEDRRDMRHHDFEGYKPEELGKIDKARIFEQNGYSILIIADDAEEIEKAFKSITEG